MADSTRIVTNLVRHWWVLTAGVLIGGMLGALYVVLAPPTYTADAYVIVVAADPGWAATQLVHGSRMKSGPCTSVQLFGGR